MSTAYQAISPLNIPPYQRIRDNYTLVLASSSPRRKGIFDTIGIPYEVHVSDFAEDLDKASFETSGHYAMGTAVEKAKDVYGRLKAANPSTRYFVVAADTVVVNQGKVLEKPASPQEAVSMLESLNGGQHEVYTGVSIVIDNLGQGRQDAPPQHHSFFDQADIEFYSFERSILEAYVKTGDPLDKAGAYGYQSQGYFLPKAIHGDVYTVIGFPLTKFIQFLIQWDKEELMRK
ncbi:hypothetical protein EV182_001791 [Spiromyces aspiralis]|uniref:Uncharacterized protein n=1 Tax=Spiromyces aspiralis TaxID=68401 RepID=A0ACC1HTD2_9FUNG|nr:hypothetical protein EV182_001791 [Spiromyces aspiralis]